MDNKLIQLLTEADIFKPVSKTAAAGRKVEAKKKQQELIAQIDWRGLEVTLTGLLGTPITVKSTIQSSGIMDNIVWISNEDLLQHIGILSKFVNSVYVTSRVPTGLGALQEYGHYKCYAILIIDYGETLFEVDICRLIYTAASKKWEIRES